jgi:hypothetical protein
MNGTEMKLACARYLQEGKAGRLLCSHHYII